MNLELIYYRLDELKDLMEKHTEQDNENFRALRVGQQEVRDDVLTLKVKAGLWGAVAGTVMAAVVTALLPFILRLFL